MKDGVQQNMCNVCGLVLKSYGAVHTHINKSHLGIKQKCVYCPKTSFSYDSIKVHMKKCNKRPMSNDVEYEDSEDITPKKKKKNNSSEIPAALGKNPDAPEVDETTAAVASIAQEDNQVKHNLTSK